MSVRFGIIRRASMLARLRTGVALSRAIPSRYDTYRIGIGRSLLLGLEVLVAADIVKTIAIELTFGSLGLLAGLVLVRTFLSWTLVLEIDGRWPWQRPPASAAHSEQAGDP
jgi:uncharacterized membrane protein